MTECSSTWLLGGYGIIGTDGTFTRTYKALPAHNEIYFSVTFWILDLNSNSNLFKIYFDGSLLQLWNSLQMSNRNSTDFCGSNIQDFPSIRVTGEAPHTATILTLSIVSLINIINSVSSFGFRDINLLFLNLDKPDSSSSACQFLTSASTSVSCLCPDGQYNTPLTKACSACAPNCQSCIGSSASQCAACMSGYSFDGEQCSLCHSTCIQCKGSTEYDCLRCNSSSYLYWNGTCQITCDSPLLTINEGDYNLCNLPCEKSEYLYENNTCLSECRAPFVKNITGEVLTCNSPCHTMEFYNSSSGLCVSNCNSPFISIQEGILKKCVYSDHSNSNSTDSESKTPSDTSGSSKTQPNSDTSLISPKSNKILKNVLSGVLIIGFAINLSSPTSLFVLALSNLISYIQYLNINYPDIVEELFNAKGEFISFSLSSQLVLPSNIRTKFPKRALPAAFEKRDLHSSFLINDWDNLTQLIIPVFLALAVWPITYAIKGVRKTILIVYLKKLISMFRWNFFMLIFFSNYGGLVLYTSLQFKTLKFSCPEETISFLMCCQR